MKNRVKDYFEVVEKNEELIKKQLRRKKKEKQIKNSLGQYWVIPSGIVDSLKTREINLNQFVLVQMIENLIKHGETHTCFVSNTHFSEVLGVSERTIMRELKDLIKRRIVFVKYRKSGSVVTKRYLATKWTWKHLLDE